MHRRPSFLNLYVNDVGLRGDFPLKKWQVNGKQKKYHKR